MAKKEDLTEVEPASMMIRVRLSPLDWTKIRQRALELNLSTPQLIGNLIAAEASRGEK